MRAELCSGRRSWVGVDIPETKKSRADPVQRDAINSSTPSRRLGEARTRADGQASMLMSRVTSCERWRKNGSPA